MSSQIESPLPLNLDAERRVLCMCLLSTDDMTRAAEILKPSDFYSTAHRLVFKAMAAVNNRNDAVELVSVTTELRRTKELNRIGGAAFVSGLADYMLSGAGIEHYIKIVKDYATTRSLVMASNEIIKQCAGEEPVNEILEAAQQKIISIEHSGFSDNIQPMSDLVDSRFRHWEAISQRPGVTGLPSGLDIDKITGGFQKTDLYLLAARPGMGKTALVMTMAANMAKVGASVGIFSLEMSKDQLIDRWAASQSRVDGFRFRTGYFKKESWPDINAAAAKMYDWNIYIEDTPGLTYHDVRRIGRKMLKVHGINIVMVDYVQLVAGDRKEGRTREIGSISRAMKAMAKELGLPVIVLSQLSRAVEQRDNKRPKLSDLRDSGELEQDADCVMFIYRDEYYNENSKYRGQAEIVVAKHRNGPLGTIRLAFEQQFTDFQNLAYEREDL